MNLGNLIQICVAILLPIIPAYLLYRFLPSETNVDGPWQGLRIKLGGAFGGYFLLVLAIFGFIKVAPVSEVWTVRGQLRFVDGLGVLNERAITFSLKPPGTTVFPDGSFELAVFAVPDHAGVPRLPTLIVEQDGYRPTKVDLDEEVGLEKDGLRRRVSLSDTLKLVPYPPGFTEHNP